LTKIQQEKLYEKYHRLARFILLRYFKIPKHLEEDAIQEALLAIFDAANGFKPEFETQFGTYLRWKILRRLKALQKRMGRAVAIPISSPADDAGLNSQIERVMKKFGVSEGRAAEMRSRCFAGATKNRYSAYALSRAVALPSSVEIESTVEDAVERPAFNMLNAMAHPILFHGMTPPQKHALSSVFGINGEPSSISSIARSRGVTRQSVHQAYSRALEIAKKNIESRSRELNINPLDFA
jgi:RNA polymerase sigma factor (sigma-70 family)